MVQEQSTNSEGGNMPADKESHTKGAIKKEKAPVVSKETAVKEPPVKKEKEKKPPDPMRVLAKRAVTIAESGGASLGSAITGPQAEWLTKRLGTDPMKLVAPATVDQIVAYAQAGRGQGRKELPEETTAVIRAICKQAENRRIWPRKVAAMIVAIEEQAAGTPIVPIPS